MPFPLAHPAAVLPLRRYCERWLNFPALIIGSLVPDASYLLRNDDISTLSHQIVGGVAFGLPVGILMLAALYVLRTPAVELLPDPARRLFLSLCKRPIGPLWLAAVSLIIGIWTHVFWDSLTHNDGWIVGHLSILQTPLFIFAGRTARVCHVLWYASSFVGAGWLFIAFEKWKWTENPGLNRRRTTTVIQDALQLAVLVVLVSLLHHLLRSPLVFFLTVVLCVSLTVVFAMKMTRSHRNPPF